MIEGYNKCKAIFDIYKKLGHLNKISAPGAGIKTNPSSKVQIPGGYAGGYARLGVAQGGRRGMSKLRLDRRIMVSS